MDNETQTVVANSVAARVAESERLFHLYLQSFLELVKRVPGGVILLRYIQLSYQDDPIRSVIELLLVVAAAWYYFSRKTSPASRESVPLSEKEVDELCKLWKPAPLVEPLTDKEIYRLRLIPIITNGGGVKINVEGVPSPELSLHVPALNNVLNLALLDFLNLAHNKRLHDVAEKVIRNHGVGACGPPNFFGNQDIHINLELRLAEWMGTEASIIYGQDFATVESILPTFLKRGDVAIVDAGVNLAIQKGIALSRCNVYYYDHNDLDHLELILDELQESLAEIKPLNRRYIVTEGLFANLGDVLDVKRLVEIKKKYKFRLCLDETLSVGCMGPTGRGVAEMHGVPPKEVDIFVGSLANSLCSAGGFCVGVQPMIFAQRINSPAYCFSASLPPYSAKVAQEAIDIIEESSATNKSLCGKLEENSRFFYNKLLRNRTLLKYFDVISDERSHVAVLEFNKDTKKKLGLLTHYTNENSKAAVAHEKAMKLYFKEEEEVEKPGQEKRRPEKKLTIERVDYYSEEAVRKAKERVKLEQQQKALQRTQAQLYNLECFLLSKIANDLLVNDKILVVTNQRLLKHEILRVHATLRVFVSTGVNKLELDASVEKLGLRLKAVLESLGSREDAEKLLEREQLE